MVGGDVGATWIGGLGPAAPGVFRDALSSIDVGRGPVEFGEAMDRALRGEDAGEGKQPAADDDAEKKAREVAEELVATALVRPVLAQLRGTNKSAAPFAPGLWEKTFAPMLDAEVATGIVRSSRFGLVDRLVEDLAARSRALRGNEEPGDG